MPEGEILKILLASKNPGKLAELEAICAGLELEVVSLAEFPDAPDIPETGATFTENATAKALAYARATGLKTMADDSGLCVEALAGRPGVLSARYAGGDRSSRALCAQLLDELKDVPAGERGAAFHCVIALAAPGRLLFTVDGVCRGRIADAPRGTRGFGYDPVFIYGPLGKTFAELEPEVKNRISHRARALRAAMRRLRVCLPGPV